MPKSSSNQRTDPASVTLVKDRGGRWIRETRAACLSLDYHLKKVSPRRLAREQAQAQRNADKRVATQFHSRRPRLREPPQPQTVWAVSSSPPCNFGPWTTSLAPRHKLCRRLASTQLVPFPWLVVPLAA
jgi:hypothetical protein